MMSERVLPRYPVYVISKGRADCCLTANFLMKEGVPFHVVVEPQERELYEARYGEHVAILPFSNLGLGGIPARNWVWEHAKSSGAARHWIFDDNIRRIYRLFKGKRIPCDSGPSLAAIEDFTDRYENLAISGLNYSSFMQKPWLIPPFFQNVHIYSCLLIQNDLPFRWRGRYNEDTDLCLQVLSNGLCTALFNVFLIEKMATMTMKGGNMEQLYRGDGRLKMARSLERVWPYVVATKRRFKRPQHVVRNQWRGFDTKLKVRSGVDLAKLGANEYGLQLHKIREVRSREIKALLGEE